MRLNAGLVVGSQTALTFSHSSAALAKLREIRVGETKTTQGIDPNQPANTLPVLP